jgi:hypothetical protein
LKFLFSFVWEATPLASGGKITVDAVDLWGIISFGLVDSDFALEICWFLSFLESTGHIWVVDFGSFQKRPSIGAKIQAGAKIQMATWSLTSEI